MAKIPTTPQAPEFQLRPGVPPFGPSGWRGTNTESDPGSLDANELLWGENVRLRGKSIRNRPGLTLKLDLGAEAGGGMWFGALPVDNPRTRLWVSTLGIFSPGTKVLSSPIRTGAAVLHLDPTQDPVLQDHSHIVASADRQVPLVRYANKIFVGDLSTLKELIDLLAPRGLQAIDVMPTPPVLPLFTFTGYAIRSMQEFDGRLFIGLENLGAPGSSKIVTWDGLDIKDDLTGIRPPLAFGIWQDRLVAGFDATAGHIRARVAGDPPGSWTTFAAGGFQCATQGNAMQEVGPYLYIASGSDELFKFDGGTLSVATTVATADTGGSGVTTVCLHKGLLYYGWNTASPDYASSIGRHDPDSSATEWIDAYKDVTGEQANFQRLSSMVSYRGQIYIGGQQNWLLATENNDVKGTLEVIMDTGAPTLDFRVIQLLRFP